MRILSVPIDSTCILLAWPIPLRITLYYFFYLCTFFGNTRKTWDILWFKKKNQGGSRGRGHMSPMPIHADVWQKPSQYHNYPLIKKKKEKKSVLVLSTNWEIKSMISMADTSLPQTFASRTLKYRLQLLLLYLEIIVVSVFIVSLWVFSVLVAIINVSFIPPCGHFLKNLV